MEKLYSDIADNIKSIKLRIANAAINAGRNPDEIRLMAVTKTVAPEIVNIAIENGVTLLGENKAQELLSKVESYNNEKTEIHFIGALQTNKVKQIIGLVDMIESLDRISLAEEIEKQSAKKNIIMDVLIQVNIGNEATKSGVLPDEVMEFAKQLTNYPHLRLRGLMAIPPVCPNKWELIYYFHKMRQYLVDISNEKDDNSSVNVLSIGMSDDFETAIACGSTIVRIGSALFGSRNYT